VSRNDCNRCCCRRSLSDGSGSFVRRMSSRRPENAHSRWLCAAIGSLTARAGFLPKPRLHSLQNLCASSLSSRLQVAHLTMAALHHTNLSSPWPASPPPSSSAIAPTHARSPLRCLGAPLRMSERIDAVPSTN